MRLVIVVALLAGLAGCGAAGDGRYAGTMAVEQGDCGPGFGSKAPATLMLRDGKAEFAPNDGVSVLSGEMNGAGQVHVANTTPGADHKPFPQVFEGVRKGEAITGQYASPRCRATVTLARH